MHVSCSWRVLSALQDLNLYIVYFENLYTWFGFNFQVFPSLFEQMIFIKLQLIGMNLIGMFVFLGSNSTNDLACDVFVRCQMYLSLPRMQSSLPAS